MPGDKKEYIIVLECYDRTKEDDISLFGSYEFRGVGAKVCAGSI